MEVEAVAGFFYALCTFILLYVLLYCAFIVPMMSGLVNDCRGGFGR